MCGTPEYMSPEQARGDPLDARSDLYAVGVILYQLLTGRLPFEAESPTQVVLMHLTQIPPDPSEVAPERLIPKALVDVTLKALEKENSADRFQDADAFSADLVRGLTASEDRASGGARRAARCPNCGALNPASQKFCGECGGSTTNTGMTTLPPRTAADPPPCRRARCHRVAPTEPRSRRSPCRSSRARRTWRGSRPVAPRPGR